MKKVTHSLISSVSLSLSGCLIYLDPHAGIIDGSNLCALKGQFMGRPAG